MGMYTELQGTVVFKSEGIAKAFVSDDQWQEMQEHTWSTLVQDFKSYSRASWIPNGDIRKLDGKIVQFHTELKNYDRTIEKFLELLPDIADDWTLESKYEEYSEWTLHRKGFDDMYVNGDNSFECSWRGIGGDVVYPTFDVFALQEGI
jgi:hypothetical protein